LHHDFTNAVHDFVDLLEDNAAGDDRAAQRQQRLVRVRVFDVLLGKGQQHLRARA
jgi:hypothetical protein